MAQIKDITTKEILKNLAKELSIYILNLDIDEQIELIDKEFTRVEKRDADLLFKSGKKIIHIEIQNNYHKDMAKRMHRYYSDILFDYEEYDIYQFVIYIGQENVKMKNTIIRDNISYRYTLIDMRDIPCQKFLESSNPSAISLSILCDFGDRDKQEVVNTIIKKLIESCSDSIELHKHLKMIEILSTNRDLEKEVEKGEDMLVVDIERMPSYNLGLKRGFQEGIEEGREEGREEAIIENAKKMIMMGFDIDTIHKITGLTIDKINSIKNSDNNFKRL